LQLERQSLPSQSTRRICFSSPNDSMTISRRIWYSRMTSDSE
jgi:hypothetical protein